LDSVLLKSGRYGGCYEVERHAVSTSTNRWPERILQHEVRYTGDEKFKVITTSKSSGVAGVMHGLIVEVPGPKIRQNYSSA